MNRVRLIDRDDWQSQLSLCHLDGRSGYLMREEEYILQSVTMRAPLEVVLNGICSALDCQIGNVVSFFSLPWDKECELSEIAMKAASFGLSNFCTQLVFSESREQLGYLEMYGYDRRSPSAREFQLIERATCLAAVAIQLEYETKPRPDSHTPTANLLPGNFLSESDYLN
jgi:hypothetical protein